MRSGGEILEVSFLLAIFHRGLGALIICEKKERIAAEKTKKRVREEKSETPKENKFVKTLDKIAKPVKGFIERIIEILSSFLIGSGLLRLIDILKDPMGYLDRIVDWANGIIKGIEDQIKKIISPFYDATNFVISQINNIGQRIEEVPLKQSWNMRTMMNDRTLNSCYNMSGNSNAAIHLIIYMHLFVTILWLHRHNVLNDIGRLIIFLGVHLIQKRGLATCCWRRSICRFQ